MSTNRMGTKTQPQPFCAVCGEDIRPDLVEMRPLGRHGAMVRVCPGCDPRNKDVK